MNGHVCTYVPIGSDFFGAYFWGGAALLCLLLPRGKHNIKEKNEERQTDFVQVKRKKTRKLGK